MNAPLALAEGVFVAWSEHSLRVGHVGRPLETREISPHMAALLFHFSEPKLPQLAAEDFGARNSEETSSVLEAVESLCAEGLLVPRDAPRTATVSDLKVCEFELGRAVPLYPDIAILSPEFTEHQRACGEFTLTSVPLMYAMYSASRYLAEASIDGDVVECGTWRGGSVMLAARVLKKLGDTSRDLYLYDTFDWTWDPAGARDALLYEEGGARSAIGAPTEEESNAYRPAFQRGATESEVRANVVRTGYPEERIFTVKGLVQDTIPQVVPEKIALLRLDTDYFESTLHELVHLYPRLVSGGVLIIDDYGKYGGATAAVDQYLRENGVRLLLNRVDIQGRIAIKP